MRNRTLERRLGTRLGPPASGDYRWDGEVWRRWDGRRWAIALYALRPARLNDPRPLTEDPERDDEVRAWALERAIQDQILNNKATLLVQNSRGAVLGFRKPVSHFLHAVMTVVTAGLWAVIWAYSALTQREDRVMLDVDLWGNVWIRRGTER
ncbi:hypothetical protein ACLM5J_06150 [Nocardioides sp. Bht2]|uniref:hypothetical protein n=1 Tax=Nocardioides sp. Bht2 TaxID=3392297 RepID=UPI0039B68207